MEINPSEVTKILKEQIKNFGEKAEVSEVGQVLSVGDGIARIYGLDNVLLYVHYENNVYFSKIFIGFVVNIKKCSNKLFCMLVLAVKNSSW